MDYTRFPVMAGSSVTRSSIETRDTYPSVFDQYLMQTNVKARFLNFPEFPEFRWFKFKPRRALITRVEFKPRGGGETTEPANA